MSTKYIHVCTLSYELNMTQNLVRSFGGQKCVLAILMLDQLNHSPLQSFFVPGLYLQITTE